MESDGVKMRTSPDIRSGAPVLQLGSANRTLKGEDTWDFRGPVVHHGESLWFGGVFDGHGGKRASLLCRLKLINYLLEACSSDCSSASLRRAAEAAMVRAHDEMRQTGQTDGTTATIVIANVDRAELTVANAGDSAAMLIPDSENNNCKPQIVSAEHRLADSEAERQRVKAMGGKLAHAKGRDGRPAGPLRLWPGGVAQARAIGDADVGRYIDPRPATCTIPFPSSSFSVIVCSDGVWDALEPAAVVASVRRSRHSPAATAAELVVDAAVRQLYAYDCDGYRMPRDDTTCVMIRVVISGGEGGAGCSCAIS